MYGWIHAWKQEGWLLCVRETHGALSRCYVASRSLSTLQHVTRWHPQISHPVLIVLGSTQTQLEKSVCACDGQRASYMQELGHLDLCWFVSPWIIFISFFHHVLSYVENSSRSMWFLIYKREFNIGRDLYSCRTAPLINKSKQLLWQTFVIVIFIYLFIVMLFFKCNVTFTICTILALSPDTSISDISCGVKLLIPKAQTLFIGIDLFRWVYVAVMPGPL